MFRSFLTKKALFHQILTKRAFVSVRFLFFTADSRAIFLEQTFQFNIRILVAKPAHGELIFKQEEWLIETVTS